MRDHHRHEPVSTAAGVPLTGLPSAHRKRPDARPSHRAPGLATTHLVGRVMTETIPTKNRSGLPLLAGWRRRRSGYVAGHFCRPEGRAPPYLPQLASTERTASPLQRDLHKRLGHEAEELALVRRQVGLFG
jgi:hypothetical protein